MCVFLCVFSVRYVILAMYLLYFHLWIVYHLDKICNIDWFPVFANQVDTLISGTQFAHMLKHHHYMCNSRIRLLKNHHARPSCGYCPSSFLSKSNRERKPNKKGTNIGRNEKKKKREKERERWKYCIIFSILHNITKLINWFNSNRIFAINSVCNRIELTVINFVRSK